MNPAEDIVSVPDDTESLNFVNDAVFSSANVAGETVDAEIIQLEDAKQSRASGESKAKTGPPNISEWQDFVSEIIIKVGSDYYLELAFRDVDENALSERELDRIRLGKDERDRIAKPVAELANKLKITRKHGRTILAGAGTFDSLITLGQWVSRVNRIASKYKTPGNRTQRAEAVTDVGTGQATPNGSGTPKRGSGFASYRIFNPGSG